MATKETELVSMGAGGAPRELRHVRFQPAVFAKEFFYHLLIPWSIPICFALEGWQGVKAHFFSPTQGAIFVVQMCLYMPYWIAFVLIATLYDAKKDHTGIILVNFAIYTGLLVVRAVAVGFKYALAPARDIRDVKEGVAEPEEWNEWHLSKWLNPTNFGLLRAVELGCLRRNINMFEEHFTYDEKEHGADLTRMLEGCDEEMRDRMQTLCSQFEMSGGRLPALRVVFAFLIRATQLSPFSKLPFFGIVVAFISNIIPLLVILGEGTAPKQFANMDIAHYIMLFVGIFSSTAIGSPIYQFLLIGMVDYKRRLDSFVMLNELVRPRIASKAGTCMFTSIEYEDPALHLNTANNIRAFVHTRRLLGVIGRGFQYRLQLNASLSLVLQVGLFVWLIVRYATGNPLSMMIGMEVLFNVVFAGAAVGMMTNYGMKANFCSFRTKEVMHRQQFNLLENAYEEAQLKEPTHAQSNNLQLIKSISDEGIKILQMENLLHPIKILGVRCGPALFSSVFGVLLSMVSVAVQVVLVGNGGQS